MPLRKENLIMVVGAVIVVLLQIILAPYIAIGYATPNFMLAYAVAIAVVRPNSTRVAMLAFIMGLLYNLFMGGPVGALAIALILTCIVAGKCMAALDNDTLFMPLAIMAIACLLTELIYGFLMCMGTGISLGDAMVMRAVPCFLYDVVLSLVIYFVMSKLASEPDGTVSLGGPTLLR